MTTVDSIPVKFLRVSATVLVALTFFVAGAQKMLHPEPGLTMLTRYAATARAVTAIGCGEIAVGLWLMSFRFPRSAATTAAVALLGFSLLMGLELCRTRPLPCGCLPLLPNATEPHAARRDLWLSLGRNGFLLLLTAGAAGLAPQNDESGPYSA